LFGQDIIIKVLKLLLHLNECGAHYHGLELISPLVLHSSVEK